MAQLRVSPAPLGRLGTGLLCLVALLTTMLTVTGASGAAPTGAAEPSSKITPALLAALDDGAKADFWVRLSGKADTARARAATTRTARGQQVIDVLKQTSAGAQAPAKRLLDSERASYRSFWITNAILVKGATRTLADQLAALDGVTELRKPQPYQRIEPVKVTPSSVTPNGLEWGLANINADDVWSEFGTRGENIVVANIDTGVQFDHPALVNSYRGNNGDGTFDHNYNWFDAYDYCQDDNPCDSHGHGTHTMGTMVGDDGAGNQIGVAPGARWIAANGCCPSDEALALSGEWLLAPTDLNGQNPDVSKRPHIINNSWGTEQPSNDPLMEDIFQAWTDSGIFGAFANGNIGPDCETSGAPGSRTLIYSAGAHDEDNVIASFSSRGPGQDGEIKPNISAPGVNVRSAMPGNTYAAMNGTSMATPHLAGAIALLWSAVPALTGDIAATRELLDLSAVDTAALECGGTVQDNNVYGEGRLDAAALVRTGTLGLGTLTGRVTDAATGQPLARATVLADGPVTRTVTTGEDGGYSVLLFGGEYRIRVSQFGYQEAGSTVPVERDATTTHDVALTPALRVAISGLVRDGGAHGWPLYAKVVASDGAGHSFTAFTDPATGRYSVEVVADTGYTVRITSVQPGYDPAERTVAVGSSAVTVDAALPVALSCDAPGYRATHTGGATETFEGKAKWRVSDVNPNYPGYDHRPGWVFTNPGNRPNNTGGSGRFAVVDSDHYGQYHVQNTYLTSPTVDMSRHQSPFVVFANDLNPSVNSTATVEVSVDDGRTWTRVWRSAGFSGPRDQKVVAVPLPQAVGKRSVQARLHYTGQWSGWWQVDDLFLGNRTCDPVAGGLVVGEVTGAGSAGITGATVTSTTDQTRRATTVATPEDPARGDGLYWLFSPAGSQGFTATANGHAARTSTVPVTADGVTRLDFTLTPG